jgi:hypothetical protein
LVSIAARILTGATLGVLEKVSGHTDIPEEYIRRHPKRRRHQLGLFKQVMLISEVNGRISELRGKGYVIVTSVAEDKFGFKFHRLVRVPAAQQL